MVSLQPFSVLSFVCFVIDGIILTRTFPLGVVAAQLTLDQLAQVRILAGDPV